MGGHWARGWRAPDGRLGPHRRRAGRPRSPQALRRGRRLPPWLRYSSRTTVGGWVLGGRLSPPFKAAAAAAGPFCARHGWCGTMPPACSGILTGKVGSPRHGTVSCNCWRRQGRRGQQHTARRARCLMARAGAGAATHRLSRDRPVAGRRRSRSRRLASCHCITVIHVFYHLIIMADPVFSTPQYGGTAL